MKEEYYQIHVSRVRRTIQEIEDEPSVMGQMNFYQKGFLLVDVAPGLPEPATLLHSAIDENGARFLDKSEMMAAWLALTSQCFHATELTIFKEVLFNFFLNRTEEDEETARGMTAKALEIHAPPDWEAIQQEYEEKPSAFTSWSRSEEET